jgi:thiopurine S-methyltransferase
MEHQFWLERWEQNQIGFHQAEINRYLSEHWQQLGLPDGAPVFVPLCGKSLDMLWLREQGHAVLGIELSEKAVSAFFEENSIPAEVHREGSFSTYIGEGLRLLSGDFFALKPGDLEGIHAVYDRAALIALPPEMRQHYAQHMAELLPAGAHILLVTMEYPEGTLEGPPFSVEEEEVHTLFGDLFTVERQAVWEGAEGPRGVAVTEKVYTLKRR